MRARFHKQSWRSPAYKYELFKILFHRHSYISPDKIAYSFELVIFGYELHLEILRPKPK